MKCPVMRNANPNALRLPIFLGANNGNWPAVNPNGMTSNAIFEDHYIGMPTIGPRANPTYAGGHQAHTDAEKWPIRALGPDTLQEIANFNDAPLLVPMIIRKDASIGLGNHGSISTAYSDPSSPGALGLEETGNSLLSHNVPSGHFSKRAGGWIHARKLTAHDGVRYEIPNFGFSLHGTATSSSAHKTSPHDGVARTWQCRHGDGTTAPGDGVFLSEFDISGLDPASQVYHSSLGYFPSQLGTANANGLYNLDDYGNDPQVQALLEHRDDRFANVDYKGVYKEGNVRPITYGAAETSTDGTEFSKAEFVDLGGNDKWIWIIIDPVRLHEGPFQTQPGYENGMSGKYISDASQDIYIPDTHASSLSSADQLVFWSQGAHQDAGGKDKIGIGQQSVQSTVSGLRLCQMRPIRWTTTQSWSLAHTYWQTPIVVPFGPIHQIKPQLPITAGGLSAVGDSQYVALFGMSHPHSGLLPAQLDSETDFSFTTVAMDSTYASSGGEMVNCELETGLFYSPAPSKLVRFADASVSGLRSKHSSSNNYVLRCNDAQWKTERCKTHHGQIPNRFLTIQKSTGKIKVSYRIPNVTADYEHTFTSTINDPYPTTVCMMGMAGPHTTGYTDWVMPIVQG
jgi:hypothetical protein